MSNCEHKKFKRINSIQESWLDNPLTNKRDYFLLQEMECTGCGITTYYTIGENRN